MGADVTRHSGPEFDRFLRDALPGLGLDWRRHRRRGPRRRVAERMKALGLRALDQYRLFLENDPEEKNRLRALLGVTISRFLREAAVFENLALEVWPAWAGRDRAVMFSAGCAGGEEPFSLAMMWRERGPAGVRPVILAMDIDRPSLERAGQGVYAASQLREMPESWRTRYFTHRGPGWHISPAIRAMVHFYRADLRDMGPPQGLDLAMCRNMAYTYFTRPARLEVTRALARSLKPGAWLVVGAKERLETMGLFEMVRPCIYRKTTPGP